MSNPDDHFHYGGCFGQRQRRSPAVGGNNNNNGNNNNAARRGGLFNIGQGGRTVLPPLHMPFRASRSPAPEQSFVNQYAQQEVVQGRSDYNISQYGQPSWPINSDVPSGPHQSTSYPSDPRYSVQHSSYSSYPSRASPAIPTEHQDTRTLPPLSVAQSHMFPGTQHQSISGHHIRSPTAGYPTQYAPFPAHTSQQTGYPYPSAPDPRNLPPPVSSMSYDASPGAVLPRRGSLAVDRTIHSRQSVHGAAPYARGLPPPSDTYDTEAPGEPPVKKKRKRADAEQLKVLNETYSRTHFPSTEERHELAKKLGMSARSVQIWFQNKRQSMRQSTRQSTSTAPPTTTEPFTAAPQPGTMPAGATVPSSGPYGHAQPNAMSSVGMVPPGYTQRSSGDPSVMAHSFGRIAPSPAPGHHRGRSHEDEHSRRPPSRPY